MNDIVHSFAQSLLQNTTAFVTAGTAFLIALSGVLAGLIALLKVIKDLKSNTQITSSTADRLEQVVATLAASDPGNSNSNSGSS